jgi:AraC-like DNA-binding protein
MIAPFVGCPSACFDIVTLAATRQNDHAPASRAFARPSKKMGGSLDAISDVLKTINLTGVIFLRAELGREYGIASPPPTVFHPVIKPKSPEHRLVLFHIVREGQGYWQVEGQEAQKVGEGDLLIVFDDLDHSVMDSPGRPTIHSRHLITKRDAYKPDAAHLGDGEPTMRLICGMLEFVNRGFNPVFSALPPFLRLKSGDGPSTAWMQASFTHIIDEAESGRPGSESMLAKLTELLFVETLRSYLQTLPEDEKGFFAGMNDETVGRAIGAIHENPAHAWTVAELAKKAGASRSAFSPRFGEVMGIPPMAYVTRWRIRLATNLLEESEETVASIAAKVGYESESAFNRAFKKEMGVPPAAWRKGERSAVE